MYVLARAVKVVNGTYCAQFRNMCSIETWRVRLLALQALRPTSARLADRDYDAPVTRGILERDRARSGIQLLDLDWLLEQPALRSQLRSRNFIRTQF